MQRSIKSSRWVQFALATLTTAALAHALPLQAQVEGNIFPPTLAYTPASGTTINLTGVTTIGSTGSGQILVTPSGGMGSGAQATNVITCGFVGNNASAFGVAPPSSSFTPTSGPTQLNLSCTSSAATTVGTLSCNEAPGGSSGANRSWPVTCPAGTLPVPPTLSYAPPTGSTINFQPPNAIVGSTATAQIRVTPSGGSAGSGSAVTTKLDNCALTNETIPGTFGGFNTTLTFVGNTAAPQNLNLTALVRTTAVTATLTCTETRGGSGPIGPDGNVFPRTWQLQVGAGTPPSRLSISKTVSAAQVLTDSEFSYTIEVANGGSSAESGLIVLDDVPSTLTVLSASGAGWNCSVIGNAVDCRRSSLIQNSSSSFDILVRAPSTPRSITNTARATSQASSSSIASTVTVEVVARPQVPVDLRLDKRDSVDPVLTGAEFSYTLEVANIGDGTATGVVVSDTLPNGLTLISASGAGFSCGGTTSVSCSLAGPLAPGASASVQVLVRAPAQEATLSNTASVQSDAVDANGSNNSDTETTVVSAEPPPPPLPRADLAIGAQAVPASALTGQAVEFQVQVSNNGPDAAAQPRMSATFATALDVRSAAGTGWSCQITGQNLECNHTGLGVNARADIRVQTVVRPGATGVADARFVISSPTADPLTGNNQATVSVPFQAGGSDVSIVKTDSVDPVRAAAQYNYVLTVSNAGPEAATGVKVTDALPATLSFVSASGAGFTCTRSGQNISCDLGASLAAGASAAVTIAVRAPTTGQTINNEGVVSSTSIDRNPANNRSSQSTRINDRTAEDIEALLDDAAIDPASQAALPVVADECAIRTSALAEACTAIIGAADAGHTSEVTDALRAIAPDEVLAQTRVLNDMGATQFFNVDARLNELRRGGGGFSLSGLTVNSGNQSIPLALVGDALQEALGFGDIENGLVSPWGFFINGNITNGDQNENIADGRVGVAYDSVGITAGVDYRLSSRSVVGGAIGYSSLSSDVGSDSTLDAKSLLFTGYGSYYINERFYIDSRLTYGSASLDQERAVAFQVGSSVFDERAIGETDATQFTLASSIGYHLNYGAWSVTPNAGVRYTSNDVDGFEESGANEFNVGYEDQSFSTVQFAVGVQVARALSLSSGVLMPQFDISLNTENGDDPSSEAYLLDGSTTETFLLQEQNPDSSYGAAGLGFVYLMGNGRQAFLTYRQTFGNDDFDRGTLNLGGRFEF